MAAPAPSAAALAPLLETVKPWLSRPNVVGLSIGAKTVGGHRTDEPAVVVQVLHKKPAADLGPADLSVPARLDLHQPGPDGAVRVVPVATDVVETGPDRLEVLTQRVRPAPGAYQVDAENMPASGTLGVNIVWAGRYRLLSANHVIANNGNLGSQLFQPEKGSSNGIGTVDGFVPVLTYPDEYEPHPVYNRQDLAYSDATTAKTSPEIYQLGIPDGVRAPRVGEKIRMIGKGTGHVREALISAVDLKRRVEWPAGAGRWAWFERQIELDGVTTQPGDSGTAYVAVSDDCVVGLHVAANARFSWGCQLWPY